MPKMMNVTLENYRTQCDSQVFIFPKMGTYKEIINASTGEVLERIELNVVDVPERLVPFLVKQMHSKGVFLVPEDPAQFDEAKRSALIRYLNGRLRTREVNYMRQKDEYEKMGATFQYPEAFEETIRWAKEIRHILNQQRPIRETGSFLEHFNVPPMQEQKVSAAESQSSGFGDLAKAKYPSRRGRGKAEEAPVVELNG